MKQIIITLLFALEVCCVSAQNLTSAFFVFRNDGPVLPFFYEDVDSIRQSKIDTDSIERPEFVTTEFWTSDSVYRVPIASIDSIAFRTPSEIRKPRSKEISDELLSYLVAVDSLTLKFSPSVPKSILPEKGDKLTYCNSNELLLCGFIGQVNSVNIADDYVTVRCDSIGIPDAFIRYCQIGRVISEEESISRGSSYIKEIKIYTPPFRKKKEFSFNKFFGIEVNDNYTFGYSNELFLSLEAIPKAKLLVYYSPETEYPIYHINFDEEIIIGSGLGINGDVSLDLAKFSGLSEIKAEFPIPIPLGKLVKFVVEPDITIGGSIALSVEASMTIKSGFKCFLSDSPTITNHFVFKQPEFSKPEVTVNMFTGNISYFRGLFLGLSVGNKNLVEVKGGVSVGQELSYELGIGKKEFEHAQIDVSTYEKFKSVSLSEAYVIKPKFTATFGKHFSFGAEFKHTIPLVEMTLEENKSFGFPEFSQPEYIVREDRSYIEYDIEGDLLAPVRPGIKVVDEDGNTILTKYHYEEFQSSTQHIEFSYRHNIYNKKCTIYPIFKYCNREIMASPTQVISLYAHPVTDNSRAWTYSALIGGYLLFDDEMEGTVDTSDWTVGFLYSTSPENIQDGTRITAYLRSDHTFTADIDGLSPETEYYYCAYLQVGEEIMYGEVRYFKTEAAEEIDLGLSVNWRAWNVGASHKHEAGEYFAWGEDKSKIDYNWFFYFDNPYSDTFEWTGCKFNLDISGMENHDPSTRIGDWRMPTREEMQELLNKCDWKWITVRDVNGYMVTGPNGNSIFLPVTGIYDGQEITNSDAYGAYWTSTPQADTEGKATAATLYFYGGMLKSLQWANRYAGRAVRPVRDKQ